MDKQHITVLISGLVEGVGYRAFVQRYALDNHIAGYAEKLSDGRIEVVAEGWPEDLDHLLIRLKTGPAHAKVKHLEISYGGVSNLEDFYTY